MRKRHRDPKERLPVSIFGVATTGSLRRPVYGHQDPRT